MKQGGHIPNYEETYDVDYFGGMNGLYLHHIDQRVKKNCPSAVNAAVEFMCTTTRGMGHNRHRAKLSRLLKHVTLSDRQRESMLRNILQRFESGDIDEQFIEQLRFALWLDREQSVMCANTLLKAEKSYIVRYAKKMLNLGGAKL